MKALIAFLLVLLGACAAQAPEQVPDYRHPQAVAFIPDRDNPTCAILRVVDGGTLDIGCRDSRGNARLVGFDTPETYRPGCPAEKRLGQAAKVYLTGVLEKAGTIDPAVKGRDRYGRTLLRLEVDGVDLATMMVSAGYAVYYSGGKRIDWCARLSA